MDLKRRTWTGFLLFRLPLAVVLVSVFGVYIYREVQTVETKLPRLTLPRNRDSEPAQFTPAGKAAFLQKLDKLMHQSRRLEEDRVHYALVSLFQHEELKAFLFSLSSSASEPGSAEARLVETLKQQWSDFQSEASKRRFEAGDAATLKEIRDRALKGNVLVGDSAAVDRLIPIAEEELAFREDAIRTASSMMIALRIFGVGIKQEPPASAYPYAQESYSVQMPWGKFTPSFHHPWVRISPPKELRDFRDSRSPEQAASAAIRVATAEEPCSWPYSGNDCFSVAAVADFDDDGIYEIVLERDHGGNGPPETRLCWLTEGVVETSEGSYFGDILIDIPAVPEFYGSARLEGGVLKSTSGVWLQGDPHCCPSLRENSLWRYIPKRGFVQVERDSMPTPDYFPASIATLTVKKRD